MLFVYRRETIDPPSFLCNYWLGSWWLRDSWWVSNSSENISLNKRITYNIKSLFPESSHSCKLTKIPIYYLVAPDETKFYFVLPNGFTWANLAYLGGSQLILLNEYYDCNHLTLFLSIEIDIALLYFCEPICVSTYIKQHYYLFGIEITKLSVHFLENAHRFTQDYWLLKLKEGFI